LPPLRARSSESRLVARRLLLTSSAAGAAQGILGQPAPAQAVYSVALDNRPLSEIDPSRAVFTVDKKSSKVAEVASDTIRDVRDRVRAALARFQADPTVDLNADFAIPQDAKPWQDMVESPMIKDVKLACVKINEIVDDTTREDTERLARLLVIAWNKLTKDEGFKLIAFGKEGWLKQQAIRSNPKVQKRLTIYMNRYLEVSDKLLKFFE